MRTLITPADALERAEIGTCTVADEIVWDNLPDFQKRALGRVFLAEVDERVEVAYSEGYEEGATHHHEKIRDEALSQLEAHVLQIFKELKDL